MQLERAVPRQAVSLVPVSQQRARARRNSTPVPLRRVAPVRRRCGAYMLPPVPDPVAARRLCIILSDGTGLGRHRHARSHAADELLLISGRALRGGAPQLHAHKRVATAAAVRWSRTTRHQRRLWRVSRGALPGPHCGDATALRAPRAAVGLASPRVSKPDRLLRGPHTSSVSENRVLFRTPLRDFTRPFGSSRWRSVVLAEANG